MSSVQRYTWYRYVIGQKPKISVPTAVDLCLLSHLPLPYIALGKRLPGPLSDRPAPDRVPVPIVAIVGCVATQVGLDVIFDWYCTYILPKSISRQTEVRPEGRWDQVTQAVNKKTRSDRDIT